MPVINTVLPGGSSARRTFGKECGNRLHGLLLFFLAVLSYSPVTQGIELHGFAEFRAGARLQSDADQKQQSLGEGRLQLDYLHYGNALTVQWRSDLNYDWVTDETETDLETGDGLLDIREANILFSPHHLADVKAGRQILTWGTGDLLFINDLFPKDWQSFLLGRDEEYLKAPSDALFISFFPPGINIDVVYTPRFDADRYVDGTRLSYWNPMQGARAGRDAVIPVEERDAWFEEDEWAVRLSKNVSGYEWAAYGYQGYWKSPEGFDSVSGRAVFPSLRVYGASIRGQWGGGILNAEVGYYDSLDDQSGNRAGVPNSEWRGLAGYSRELRQNLTGGIQYYIEQMTDYDAYTRSLSDSADSDDESRHLLTFRLTQLLMSQNLQLSLFTFYSPTDRDAYMRPALLYKYSDAWQWYAGGNLFFGDDAHTFFGQFEKNSNLYAGLRYSF